MRLFERYGLDVSVQTIDVPALGLRTRVLRAGEGPPVLFLHGGSGTSALWAPLIARMPGFTTFAVDRPGAGTGAAFDYTGLDLRDHATTFLESVLDGLGLTRVPLVANSLGGLWSFWLAAHRPARVSALVQLGCPALVFGTRAPLAMRFLSLGPIRSGDRRNRAAQMLRHVAGEQDLAGLPAEFVDCLYAAETRSAHVRTRASFLLAAADLQRRDPHMGMGLAELARIDCPVLFVWGRDDWYGPPEVGRRACELLAQASLEVVEAAHLPWLQEPERCAELAGAAILATATTERGGPAAPGDEDRVPLSLP
jgi:pimeloyl-ACP methyl ester carboxylesterase